MTYNRLCAYTIDMLIVMLLTYLLANTYSLNPFLYDREDAYNNYKEVYDKIDFNGEPEETMKALNEMNEPLYNLERVQVYELMWYVVLMIFYFVIFQTLNNGQTIGKKICRLKVVKKDNGEAGPFRLLLHSLMVGSSFYYGFNLITIINVIALALANKEIYMPIYFIITFLGMALEVIYYILVFASKDNRWLNDIIAGVKTVEVKK